MGLEDTSFEVFYAAICEMLDRLEIPNSLVDIGVPADCAATIASRAIQDCNAVTTHDKRRFKKLNLLSNLR